MLRVHLKRDWYGPNNHLYQRSESRYDLRPVPDQFKDKLPKDAAIVAEDNDPAIEPLETKSILAEKFEEADRTREQVDQGLANAIAVSKAQDKPVTDPSLVKFDTDPARTEVRISNLPVEPADPEKAKDDELAAAIARRKGNKG